jgi:hypothetical protein
MQVDIGQKDAKFFFILKPSFLVKKKGKASCFFAIKIFLVDSSPLKGSFSFVA